MKREYLHAFNALKKLGVPVYTRDDMDGRFQISAEEPDSYLWCSYWRRSDSEWAFGVNPQIDKVLRKYGLFCEWINPGELGVCKI